MQKTRSAAELMADIRFLRDHRAQAFAALLEHNTRALLVRHRAIQTVLDEYERAWVRQKYLRADD